MPRIKDITLKSKGNSQITSAGKPVKIFKFTSQAGITQEDIKKQVQELQRQNQGLTNGNYSLSIDLDFREAGWRSSEFQKMSINYENIVLFNIFDYYGEGDEKEEAFLERIGINDFDDYKYNNFNIYIKYDGEDAGGNDKDNHCLYKCLLKACYNKTTYFWKKPSYLKHFLQLEFNEKIPISCIPKIEERANVSIRVEGDYVYEPSSMKTTHIDVILKDGHYHLKRDSHTKIKKLIDFCRKTRYLLVVVGKDEFYDGDERESRFDENKQDKVYGSASISKDWFIYKAKTDDLEQEYETAKANLLLLKEKTDIDLLEYGNISSASLKSFYDLCISDNGYGSSPEPLTQQEAQWIQRATTGGIMYAKKDTHCEHAYLYDVNSLYPHTLLNMNIPASKGEFMKLETLPPKNDYLFIVKATIEKNHPLFRYNKYNLYTSYDLQNAKTLKLKIDLLTDDGINCLSYKHSRMLQGKVFFKPFVDYWFNLKKQGVPYAKRILNSLWGALTSSNKRRDPAKNDNKETPYSVPNGYVLNKMTTSKNGFEYEFMNQLQPFKYTYARLKPFLLSKAKSKILSPTVNYHIDNDTIIYSHTDSLITTKPMKFKLTDEMGGWKLEQEGSVYVKHITSKRFN